VAVPAGLAEGHAHHRRAAELATIRPATARALRSSAVGTGGSSGCGGGCGTGVGGAGGAGGWGVGPGGAGSPARGSCVAEIIGCVAPVRRRVDVALPGAPSRQTAHTFTPPGARVYGVGPTKGHAMPSHANADRARERLLRERDRLARIRAGLSGEAGETGADPDALSELSLADQHPADLGTEMFEREKDVSILERIDAELTDVERALKRVDEGTYGVCEACGRTIAKARLEARPEARFCVDDQAAAERQARAS
jgi:RNA polymerase-binding transcription factor DksA